MIKKQLLTDVAVWCLVAALYLYPETSASSFAAFILWIFTIICGLTSAAIKEIPQDKLEQNRKSKPHLYYILTTEVVEGALIFAAGHHVLGACYTLFALTYTLGVQNRLGDLD